MLEVVLYCAYMKLQGRVIEESHSDLHRSVDAFAASPDTLCQGPVLTIQCKDPPGVIVSLGLIAGIRVGYQPASEYPTYLPLDQGLGPACLHAILTHLGSLLSFPAILDLLDNCDLKTKVNQFLTMLVQNVFMDTNREWVGESRSTIVP